MIIPYPTDHIEAGGSDLTRRRQQARVRQILLRLHTFLPSIVTLHVDFPI